MPIPLKSHHKKYLQVKNLRFFLLIVLGQSLVAPFLKFLNYIYFYQYFLIMQLLIKANQMDEIKNYNQALNFYNNLQLDEAIKICNTILQKNSSHFHTWNLLGNIFFKLIKLEQAKQFFITAIEFNPEFIEAYYMLGNTLFSTNSYEDSILIWSKALEINNSELILYTNIATSYIKLNNFEDAEKYLFLALEFDNSDKFEDIFICFSEIYKLQSDFINYKKNLLK